MPSDPKSEDTLPLTVAHGRKIYDQSKQIAETLERLTARVQLLDQPEGDNQEDPIAQIVGFLDRLAAQSQDQMILLEQIDAKLDILVAGAQNA